MLLTGVVATHFLLALPFLLLSRRWMSSVAYFCVATIWSINTFVPMFGAMGQLLSPDAYPLLSPTNNAITKFIVGIYSSDSFITISIVANLFAVAWLALLAIRRSSFEQPTGAPVIS